MELKVALTYAFNASSFVQNPCNGIERYNPASSSTPGALLESMQWNWKTRRVEHSTGQVEERIHAMELKEYCYPRAGRCYLVQNPCNGIERLLGGLTVVATSTRIHAMELKGKPDGTMGWYAFSFYESMQWNWKLGLSLNPQGSTRLRRIHAMELKGDDLSRRAVGSLPRESMQWNWKLRVQCRCNSHHCPSGIHAMELKVSTKDLLQLPQVHIESMQWNWK